MQQEMNSMPANGTMTDQEESVDQQALTILQNALNRVQQLRQSYSQQISSVNALMDKNNQAVGQTQALQTSNELAAQNIAQTQSTQELLSEQISMQAAVMSKQLQEEKDEDDKMKKIFNAQDDGSSIFGPLN
jgi:P-type conjugative transfer protein TrbJ